MLCQKNSLAVEGGSNDCHAVDGGSRMSGAIGCWRMLWSEERLVASLVATPRSGV